MNSISFIAADALALKLTFRAWGGNFSEHTAPEHTEAFTKRHRHNGNDTDGQHQRQHKLHHGLPGLAVTRVRHLFLF